jgi:transposase
MQGYVKDHVIYTSGSNGNIGRTGNRQKKGTRIPETNKVEIQVRDFVRGERKMRRRVTARQVLDYFMRERLLFIPSDEHGVFMKTPFETALRQVRRWVERRGYQRGKRTGNLVPKESVLIHRNKYLRALFENRAKPPGERMREVYLDESYIHEHYHRNDDSLWDPNDDQDVTFAKAPAKGRRYCFLAAIQGPCPLLVAGDPVTSEEKAGLVAGSVWAFCLRQKRGHQGDYHKVFNGENFVQWWKDQLLPNLKQPSIIYLDNAKYHLVYGDHVPKASKMHKHECMYYLQEKGVDFEASLTAIELKKLVKDHVAANEKIEIIRLSELEGHRVELTPPYHSDFQPIELVWALIKSNVGRQYDINTTLTIVYN